MASAPAPKVGGLGWPLSGNLLARYGGKLPDGRTSSGVLIGAPAGSTVTAVADGTVVFPLERQMWGDEFGQCKDRFGVAWLVNISAG